MLNRFQSEDKYMYPNITWMSTYISLTLTQLSGIAIVELLLYVSSIIKSCINVDKIGGANKWKYNTVYGATKFILDYWPLPAC